MDWDNKYRTDNNVVLGSTPTVSYYINRNTGEVVSETHSSVPLYRGNRSRSGHTSNPFHRSGRTVWRNPSGYGRDCVSLTYGAFSDYTENASASSMYYRRVGGTMTSTPLSIANLTGGSLLGSIDQTNLNNRVATQSLGKLNEGSVNLGANILQARQTVNDLSELTSTALRLYRGFRTANLTLVKEALLNGNRMSRALAERYLLWIYGIKPLLGDIYSTHELLTKQIVTEQLFRVRSAGSISNGRNFRANTVPQASQCTQIEQLKAAITLWFRLKSSTLVTISKFGLTNPLAVAWEVLPWSFVIDWLVPVGSTLEALSAPMGFDFVGGSRSTRLTVVTDFVAIPTGSQKGQFWNVTATRNYFSRLKVNTAPIGRFYVKSPFSTQHSLNALALLRGAVK